MNSLGTFNPKKRHIAWILTSACVINPSVLTYKAEIVIVLSKSNLIGK